MWRILLLVFPILSWSQDALNVQLLDHWYEDSLLAPSELLRYNDCWGYAQNGHEYAMVGSTEGVHFFEIKGNKLESVDFVQGLFSHPSVIHRDIKTYQNYAYLVCDEGPSSLQIVDLSYLPDSVHVVYTNDSTFGRVHNLFIDEENALMYACYIRTIENGLPMVTNPMQVYSLADPTNPVFVYEGPSDIPAVHDAYVRNNIAYLNCGFDGLRVYNFSNPAAPQFLQNLSFYQDQGYNHQGWLSPDGTKYVFGDETDGKQLKICSVENNNITIERRFGTNWLNNSVAHNIMITNEFAFVAYYNEGLRIYDLRRTLPKEIAHYDTYPDAQTLYTMHGAWGIYSLLPSERILVSDRKYGLFLFDFDREAFLTQIPDEIALYPNPASEGETITVRLEADDLKDLHFALYDLQGNQVREETIVQSNLIQWRVEESAGMYLLRITYRDKNDLDYEFVRKVLVY